jgi:hypothetical protein
MEKRMLKSTLCFGIDHIDLKNTYLRIENSPVIYRKQSFGHFGDEYRKAGWLKEDQLLR